MARFLGFGLAFLIAAAPSRAATFTVNSAADTDDGVCNPANCTLREAIHAANAHSGADTIRFSIGFGVKTISPSRSSVILFR
jgi:CSLREA domain-containing protein